MRAPVTHRVNRELSAWLCALVIVAGLSLTSSFPRGGEVLAQFPSRTLAEAAQTLGDVLGHIAASETPRATMLRPNCQVLPVQDPRELAEVLRAAYTAYPDSVVTVARAGDYPQAGRVVFLCDP